MLPIKLFILFPLTFFATFSIQAQLDLRSFPLDSFRLPDIDRSALFLNGGIGAAYSNVNQGLSTSYVNSRFAPAFTLNYSRLVNRMDLQRTVNARINQSLFLRHSEGIFSPDQSITNYGSRLMFDDTHRKYNRKRFFQTGISLFSDYDYEQSSLNDDRENHFFGRASGTLGFGSGRLEPVADAAMALFLLMDAVELGIDESTISHEEVYAFASLMAQVRNRRIFDSRRMRIAELRELYSFMLEHQWVVQNDPGFFTVLTDNWFYNLSPFRYAGSRWNYSVNPFVEFSHTKSQSITSPESIQDNTDYGGYIEVDYTKYKPVSLFRDNTRQHTLSVGIVQSRFNGTIPAPNEAFMNISFENSIGRNWYPNSRTTIFTSLGGDYVYARYLEAPDDDAEEDQHFFKVSFNTQINYFLSYRTRISANAGINYQHNEGALIIPYFFNGVNVLSGINGIDADLSVSIAVSIF